MMKLIVFKTLNAPAKAGGFYQLMENKKPRITGVCWLLCCLMACHETSKMI